MTNILEKLYDHRDSNSFASKLRGRRLALFKSLIATIPHPVKILDVGGTIVFWQNSGFLEEFESIEITVINITIKNNQTIHPRLKTVAGDARSMKQFEDKEFDVVFSNSVIEHVGDYDDQRQMASEVMRIGKKYFVQTPNLYFPIEPHFVFPLFQFLPIDTRVWLLTNFDLGWAKKRSSKEQARKAVSSIRLLNKKEFVCLFPNANIFEENILGLTKSFVAYDGW